MEEHELYVNLKKCEFGKTHLDFLGHIIGADGIRVDPKKTAVVQEWPTPKNVHQLRSFLGLSNYFRRFIKNYSSMVAPMTSLLRKDRSVETDWDSSCDAAFREVKTALVTAPVLVAPDFTNPGDFEVHTDASLDGVGAALTQGGRPVAFYSRKLTGAERNYTTTEQECLAVLCALREWRCYLEGVQFTVFTDHQPLTFANTKSGVSMSRRQTRWIEELQRYTFSWKYKKGTENVADPLSRVPALFGNSVTFVQCNAVTRKRASDSSGITPSQPRKRRKLLTAEVDKVDTNLELPQIPALHTQVRDGYKVDPQFSNPPPSYTMKNGLWWKGDKLVIPAAHDLRVTLLREAHDSHYSGHLGFKKTLDLLTRHYWWPHMRREVMQYTTTCDSCQRMKSSNQKPAGLLHPLPTPERNWECVSMDLITDLPLTPRGFDSVLVVVDRLSKMTHFAPCLKTISSLQLAELFAREITRLHGFQKSIVMDRDPRFTNHFWRNLCAIYGTKLALSTAFHPQTDGQTERMNRLLEDVLRHYVSPDQTDWDK